jgi:hypothetical protein
MKKIVYILSFLILASSSCFAQDDQQGPAERIREKMVEYIQDKLNLSKSEAQRFTPIFLDYFRELRSTNQQFKSDRLVLQQKIIELRLRYRDQFKPILGEKRSNDVFVYEHNFVQEVREQLNLRRDNHDDGRANKRF